MSDRDLHRAARTLITGGIQGLDDEYLNKLNESVTKERQQRDKKALGSADAEYLSEYYKILEQVLCSSIYNTDGFKELEELNKEFKGRVNPDVMKTHLSGIPGYASIEDEALAHGYDTVEQFMTEFGYSSVEDWEMDNTWSASSMHC